MKESKSVSVVIGFYNEEKVIADTVKKTIDVLDKAGLDYEIILVDDGSTDGSFRELEAFSDNEKIIVLRNYVNLNFGTAVLRGMYSATKKYVIYNAADLPLDPNDIPEIIDEMYDEGLSMMVLEREEYKATKYRKCMSGLNILAMRILYPKLTKGTPVLNFVQCFDRDLLQQIRPVARSPIFVWPELIFRAKLKDVKWKNKRIKINKALEVRKGAFGHPHDMIWGVYDMLRFKTKEFKIKERA